MFKKDRGIHYKEYKHPNSDVNVVLIHGLGCNHKFLDPLAKQLKDDYNCYVIDLPDHNKSDNLGCQDIDQYIKAVGKFIKTKFKNNVVLIGHSLGGTITMGLSAKKLPQIEKAVVLNSSSKYDLLDKDFMNKVHLGKLDLMYLIKCCTSKLSPKILLSLFSRTEPKQVILNDFSINEKIDITNRLEDIEVPTLIMTGGDDILVPVSSTDILTEKIKKSKLLVIPGARHLMPISEAYYVSGMIMSFIEGAIKIR